MNKRLLKNVATVAAIKGITRIDQFIGYDGTPYLVGYGRDLGDWQYVAAWKKAILIDLERADDIHRVLSMRDDIPPEYGDPITLFPTRS